MQTTNSTTTQSNVDREEKPDARLEVGLVDIAKRSDRVV